MVVVDEYWRLPPFPKESLALTKAAFSVGYHQKRLKRLKKKARVVHYLAVVETSCGKTPRRGVFRKFVSGVVISRPASRTTYQPRQGWPYHGLVDEDDALDAGVGVAELRQERALAYHAHR